MVYINAADVNAAWDSFFKVNPESKNNPELIELSKIRRRVYLLENLSNPQYPAHVLHELGKKFDVHVQAKISSHPNSAAETLEQIVSHYNKYHASYVATLKALKTNLSAHPNTPEHILYELYNTNRESNFYDKIVENLARNPSIPQDLIKILWKRYNAYSPVYANLASNPSLPIGYMKELFHTRTYKSRSAIIPLCCNPNLPRDMTEPLLKENMTGRTEAILHNTQHVDIVKEYIDSEVNSYREIAVSRLYHLNFFNDFPKEWVEAQYGVNIFDKTTKANLA